MNTLQKTLGDFGFSQNEAQVYLAMLKCGEASISRIATVAKLNRITVHHIIGRLEARDLALRFGKGREKLIRATHPTAVQKKIHTSADEFDQAVPALLALMRDNSKKMKPVTRTYYGVLGFESAAEELLQKPNITIRHVGSLTEAHKFIGVKYDLEYFIPTRVSKNIRYRALQYEDEENPVVRTTNAADLRETRYLPDTHIIHTNTFIVPGKTIIVTTKNELMTVVIDSNEVADAEIQKFDLLWELLGPSARSPH